MGKCLGLVLALVVAGSVSAAERPVWHTPWPLKLPCARFDSLSVFGYADLAHAEHFSGAVEWRGRSSSLRLMVPSHLRPAERDAFDTIAPIGTLPTELTLTLACPDRRSKLEWRCRFDCVVEETSAVAHENQPRPRYARWTRREPDAELGRALVADMRDLIVDGCGDVCARGPRAALDAAAAALADGRWQLRRATLVAADFDAGGVQLTLECLEATTCTISLSRGKQLIADYRAQHAHCGALNLSPGCKWPSYGVSFPGWTTMGADQPRNHIADADRWTIDRYTVDGQELVHTSGAAIRSAR